MQIEPTKGDLGQFLLEWGLLEERLLNRARQITKRNISSREAIDTLVKEGRLSAGVAEELHSIRRIRNTAAHRPTEVDQATIAAPLVRLREVVKHLPPRAVSQYVAF